MGCDCVLICGPEGDEKQLNVHRAILMSSSPVFCAMFTNKFKENIQSEVRIDDVSSEAVTLLLKYIYAGYIYICLF